MNVAASITKDGITLVTPSGDMSEEQQAQAMRIFEKMKSLNAGILANGGRILPSIPIDSLAEIEAAYIKHLASRSNT